MWAELHVSYESLVSLAFYYASFDHMRDRFNQSMSTLTKTSKNHRAWWWWNTANRRNLKNCHFKWNKLLFFKEKSTNWDELLKQRRGHSWFRKNFLRRVPPTYSINVIELSKEVMSAGSMTRSWVQLQLSLFVKYRNK